MVEQINGLDYLFGALSDATRRDILRRVAKKQMTVKEIAAPYDISFAGVAKHLMVMQKARLIIKHRSGKQQIVSISPATLAVANKYFENFERLWEKRLDSLDKYLSAESLKRHSGGSATMAFGPLGGKLTKPASGGKKET